MTGQGWGRRTFNLKIPNVEKNKVSVTIISIHGVSEKDQKACEAHHNYKAEALMLIYYKSSRTDNLFRSHPVVK